MNVSIGADWGFRSDSTAAVAVHTVGRMLVVRDLLELRPRKGAPLVPSIVVGMVAMFARRNGAHFVVSDSHYRESITEHLNASGLGLEPAPEGASGKAEAYQVARSLLHEGRVRLPNHKRLVQQLREVVAKPTPGGGIQIASPRWRTGGHGDLVSALVCALWFANRGALYWEPPTNPALYRYQPPMAQALLEAGGELECDPCGGIRRRPRSPFSMTGPGGRIQSGGY